ncbi:ClpXP protease specificity-enhancing factor [Propionivibrio sp.]|uniref:ClpXP protease specificity-enhancing factor n=1 Tax=Propionivibrio sp. TaxID=2212460 RepID=UPI002610CFFF|nr:ClpXP protease specificity-enhancing factor [Propionivibrio sp.]
MSLPSTKPYLLRAIHEWCCDNGLTPYLSVNADGRAKVPREYVRDGQIVLNIGYEATGHLTIANDIITFQARFGGVARDISVPIGNVLAIYAKENGAGMAFEPDSEAVAGESDAPENSKPDNVPEPPAPPNRPKLHRIK